MNGAPRVGVDLMSEPLAHPGSKFIIKWGPPFVSRPTAPRFLSIGYKFVLS